MIKRLKIISVLIIISMLLTACGSKELPLDYSKNYPVSSTDKIGSRANGFSEALAVINSDVAGSLGFTVEEQSSAGLFDVNRREVLYAKNVHTQVAPASLTKIMTALIAIKYGNPDDVITCSSAVEDIDYDTEKEGSDSRTLTTVYCRTKNGIEYKVPRKAIIWVKTGTRWPRGIFLQLKRGAENTNNNNSFDEEIENIIDES